MKSNFFGRFVPARSLFLCHSGVDMHALFTNYQREGIMLNYVHWGPVLSSISKLKMERSLTQFLSILVIGIAASIAGYGQEPVSANESIPGKELFRPATEIRMTDKSRTPEDWLVEYTD